MTAYVAFMLLVMMNLVSCDNDDESPEPENDNDGQQSELNAGSGQVAFTDPDGEEIVLDATVTEMLNGTIVMEGSNGDVDFELTLDTLQQLEGDYDFHTEGFEQNRNDISLTINDNTYAQNGNEGSALTVTSVDREQKTFSGTFEVTFLDISNAEEVTMNGEFNEVVYQSADDGGEDNDDGEDEDSDNPSTLSALVGGSDWSANTATYSGGSGETLTINGSSGFISYINITINQFEGIGTYSFSIETFNGASYRGMEGTYSATSGEVEVTEYDEENTTIKGTFNFVGGSLVDEGTINVTNGTFDIVVKE